MGSVNHALPKLQEQNAARTSPAPLTLAPLLSRDQALGLFPPARTHLAFSFHAIIN